MQTMTTVVAGKVRRLNLPDPETLLEHGGTWGRFDELFSPAFWRGQVWQHQFRGTYENHRLGRDLREELAACLLGGFGMPAALALAAYDRLRSDGLLASGACENRFRTALEEPLWVAGRARRYRFPRQKARLLAGALEALNSVDEAAADRDLRNTLMLLPGIGPKTASWIVRNFRQSDVVAILDVHIVRACRLAGIFPRNETPERNYFSLERRFLQLAADLGTPASVLDALMWDYMRRLPRDVVLDARESHHRHADAPEPMTDAERFSNLAAEETQWAEA